MDTPHDQAPTRCYATRPPRLGSAQVTRSSAILAAMTQSRIPMKRYNWALVSRVCMTCEPANEPAPARMAIVTRNPGSRPPSAM
jgi:hypothetical protein